MEPSKKVHAFFLLKQRRRGLILYSTGVECEQLQFGLKSIVFVLRTPRSKIFEKP